MRAVEISSRLAEKVELVATYLLPNGRRMGHEWRVGSVDGEAGKSMGVHLSGEKAGVWLDGASGQSGDLIGLWMAVKRVDLRTACTEAMDYLGIREDRPEHRTRTYRKPDREGVHKLSPEHAAWLRDVRKLPDASVEAYRLASRGDRLMFPFLRGNELLFAKYRRLPKTFSAEADCEPILFGWQSIPGDARAVVLCEGELDAIAWHAYGYPALSVPTGSGAHAWIEGEFDALSVFDTIYLSMDMDVAGQKSIPDLCERLGRERVKVVLLPEKDANECLIKGVTSDAITICLRDARTQDPNELRNASDFADDIWNEYTRIDEGLLLPWPKTHEQLKLRPGEVSIWAGVNGHGKSAVVGNVVGALAMAGTRCCVASMEWRTPVWLARMGRQIAGIARPSRAFSDHIAKQYRDTLWCFDVAGSAKAKRILDVFAYAKRRYDIDLFVIDNLTKCGFADDDYTGQKQFVEALADFARITGCHVVMVAHMRKGDGEERPSGKHGIKGSGGITDMATTVIEIWRNLPREQAVARSKHPDAPPLPEKFTPGNEMGFDMLMRVLKQNATGNQPTFGFWYDPASTQFLSNADQRPRPLVSFSIIDAQESA